MYLDFINNSNLAINEKTFLNVMNIMLEHNLVNIDHEICLQISSENQIQGFNKKYRGKNSLTDVLSFPNEFKDIPFLGDIIIDINIADKQKADLSLEEELACLFLHGVLHLLGYDHINSQDKEKMNKIELELRAIILQKTKGDI